MSYADIVEFMFQSGCVMDKCGMKAVPNQSPIASDSSAHTISGTSGRSTPASTGTAKHADVADRRDRQRQAAHHHPMAWRLGKALDTTPDFWANLQADYDLLTFDPSTLDDIRPLVEA